MIKTASVFGIQIRVVEAARIIGSVEVSLSGIVHDWNARNIIAVINGIAEFDCHPIHKCHEFGIGVIAEPGMDPAARYVEFGFV